ncbi:MAG: hypothetical protein V4543_15580, partial [Bacteroidota bacterium]
MVSEQCSGTISGGSVPAAAYYCTASSVVSITATGTVTKPLSVGLGITYQWEKRTGTNPDVWSSVTLGTGGTTKTYVTDVTGQAGSYRLKVSCAAGGVGYSDVVNIVPLAAPTPATLPFTETFENTWLDLCNTKEIPSASWRQTSPDFALNANASWRREDDGSGWDLISSGTYSPSGSGSSHSARFHTYEADEDEQAALDLHLNFTGANNRTFSFDWINPDGADFIDVTVSTDGGTSFINPNGTALRLTNSFGWTHQSLVLSGYNAADFVIRFNATSDFGFDDMGIDNISVTEPPMCSGLPTYGTVASTSVCSGGSAIFTPVGATSSLTASGVSYKWQTSATADGTFTDIPGATSVNYTTPALTVTSYYKFVTTCSATGSVTTPVLTVTVNPYYLCYCGPGATPPNAADL